MRGLIALSVYNYSCFKRGTSNSLAIVTIGELNAVLQFDGGGKIKHCFVIK